MPRFYEDALNLLLTLAQENPALFQDLIKAIKRIQRNPKIGTHVGETAWYYREPTFRIDYDYVAGAKEPLLIYQVVLRKS